MSVARPIRPEWLDERVAWAMVAAITLIGLVPRLIHLDGSYLGDELSTLYLVANNSLPGVVEQVASDAEISPPLYFALGWAASQLGGVPELVRAPALVAGVATIPLTYLVGERAVGRVAGIGAAAAMALNPFMVFYATDARAYTVAIALLLGTTLTMLIALESGRRRWWVAYGALTCLCMLTHYTTAFVLAGQLLWLLWAHPEARRTAIVANGAAAVAFLPWLPSMLADFDSPTIEILSDLQGDGLAVKWEAVKAWAFGYPYNLTAGVPGSLTVGIALAGAMVLGVFAFGTARSLDPNVSTIDFRAAAEFVDAEAGPDDLVVDGISAAVSPVPLTALDVHLPRGREELRLYLPEGPPPFLGFPPEPRPLLARAFDGPPGSRVFFVGREGFVGSDGGRISFELPPGDPNEGSTTTLTLPRSWRVGERRSWEGISDIEVLVIERGPG